MVIPVGSLINAGTIICGALLGMVLGGRLNEGLQKIVFQGLGLCVAVIGLQMALLTSNPLILIFSLLIGAIIGQLCNLDGLLTKSGEKLKKALRSGNSTFTDGFVNATMLFGIGSMAILGPLDEGLTGDMSILLTKSMLDGFAAMAFSAAFGSGVIFSALPILLLQGTITICAGSLQSVLNEQMILSIKGTGGVIILGIALNMLELTKIKLTNLLPALPFAVLITYLAAKFAA